MRAPLDHTYTIDGQPYRLREALFEGQRRIAQHYAMALTVATPLVDPATGQPLIVGEALWSAYARTLEQIDGQNLYAKAVTQECLVEAPDFWWSSGPAVAGTNGTPPRVLTFAQVTPAVWGAHRQEVDTFLQAIFRADNPDDAPAPGGRPDEPAMVALPQTVPAVLRGRAE